MSTVTNAIDLTKLSDEEIITLQKNLRKGYVSQSVLCELDLIIKTRQARQLALFGLPESLPTETKQRISEIYDGLEVIDSKTFNIKLNDYMEKMKMRIECIDKSIARVQSLLETKEETNEG